MINVDPLSPDPADLEALAALLEQSGAYRVLRQLTPRLAKPPPPDMKTRIGLFVDVETTERDEIIELAMVPFTYGSQGELYEVGEAYSALREPTRPIPPEVTAITGIDAGSVAGRGIDPGEVAARVAPAALVVAHKRGLRPALSGAVLRELHAEAVGCSMCEVDWAGEGFEGTKLAYLAARAGFFYERHRAVHDCLAAIELLALPQPRSGRTGLAQLLERARRPQARIWAENAPYDLKDILKQRGYRWNGDGQGGPRAWYIDVQMEAREAEASFLQCEIYQAEVEPMTRKITAFERYSSRCGL